MMRGLLCVLAVLWSIAAANATNVAPVPSTYGPPVDTGWVVLSPSGGNDHAALQAAFTNSPTHPVLLNPGAYISCTPLTLPNNFNIHGRDINAWALYNGAPGIPTTYIYCPNAGLFPSGFVSGQAFISMPANAGLSGYASGFSVIGFYNGTSGTDLGVDCWQIKDGSALTQPYTRFSQIGGYNCHDGISLLATNSSLHIEGVELYDSQFNGNANFGIDSIGSAPAFVSDWKIIRTATAFNHAGEVNLSNNFGVQILDGRYEDSGDQGILLIGGSGFQINSNLWDLTFGCILVQNVTDLTVTGNRFNTYQSSPNCLEFSGANNRIAFSGNNYTKMNNYVYQVDAGASLGYAQFNETAPPGQLGLFVDLNTENTIAPLLPGQFLDRAPFAPLTLSGSTFSAPDMSANKNFLIALPNSCAPCTVSTPSTIPLPVGQHGYFAIVQSPTGGGSLTWGPLYSGWTTPTLSTIGEAIDFVEYAVTQNGISLRPQAPAQNSVGSTVLTGGAGMTSGWALNNSTFANAVGGCVDPIGGGACSQITEDGTFNPHGIHQAVSLAGIATFSEYVNAGTPHQSGSVTATFTAAGNSMNVTAVGSGAVVQGAQVVCSCAASGITVTGFNSGSGGTGTYFTNIGINASSGPVTLVDPRFLAITAIDSGFANSASMGIDPNTGNIVDAKIGNVVAGGRSTGTGIVYGASAILVPGTTWYYVSLTYGGFTAAFIDQNLGLLGQNPSGPDWTDYTGDSGGFLEVYGPTLISSSPSPTGKWTFPGAVNMPGITSGTPATGICQDAGKNFVTCSMTAGTTITDGTHTVSGATSVQFNGTVVSGSTPNAVVTVSGGATPGETFISSQTAVSGTSTHLDFTALTTAYPSLHLVCRNIIASAPNSSFNLFVGEGGGPTWETAATYNTISVYGNDAGSGTASKSGSATAADLIGGGMSAVDPSVPAMVDVILTQPNLAGVVKLAHTIVDYFPTGNTSGITATGTGWWAGDTNTLTGLRYQDNTGTFSAVCSLYGQN